MDYKKFKEMVDIHQKVYDRMNELDKAGLELSYFDNGLNEELLRKLFYATFPQLEGKTVSFELGGYVNNLDIHPLDAYDVFQWLWDYTDEGYVCETDKIKEIFAELDQSDGVLYQEDVLEVANSRGERVNPEQLNKLPRRTVG